MKRSQAGGSIIANTINQILDGVLVDAAMNPSKKSAFG